jgi:hypothetical protein
LLPILAACTPQTAPVTAPPAAPTSTVPAITASPPATLPPRPTTIPCLTRSALAAMPLAEIAAQPSLCFDSEDGVQTEIAQAAGIATIRDFLQDSSRLIGFREVTFMGNSPSGVLRVARFEDEQGASYLVAVVAGKVLEMNADPGQTEAGDELTQDQLQAMAEVLIRRELPAFDELRDRLTFEAGAKSGGMNFFRWELPAPTDAGNMPPLAQVGITDSGHIFSYINTLYFLP